MIRKRSFLLNILTRMLLLLGIESKPFGIVESVKNEISELFPNIAWERPLYVQALNDESSKNLNKTDHNTWCGRGLPEFKIIPDNEEDDIVSTLWVSRADRADIRLLEKKLDLVSFDMQRGILGMIFGYRRNL